MATLAPATDVLEELIDPGDPTEVVDVGANPIDGDPPYKALLQRGLCRVTGFEPQPGALAQLEGRKGPNERYFGHVLGDGGPATLHVCRASGMTSLLAPDPARLGTFGSGFLLEAGEVTATQAVQTQRLDDLDEIARVDFLKIDVQGSELAVIRNGKAKLSRAVFVQLEISFVEIYRDQPGFGELDLELRAMGFIPHAFMAIKWVPIAPFSVRDNPRKAIHQLLEADLVYCRDFTSFERMDDRQVRHMALVAHHGYGSFDLALRCIRELQARGRLRSDATQRYVRALNARG